MKMCKDCPFKRSSPLVGSPDWLKDVLKLNQTNKFFSHTCHETDPNADGFKGKKKVRECGGHLTVMFNDLDKTPGKGGVYDSIGEMAQTYLKHWTEELMKRGKNEKTN